MQTSEGTVLPPPHQAQRFWSGNKEEVFQHYQEADAAAVERQVESGRWVSKAKGTGREEQQIV